MSTSDKRPQHLLPRLFRTCHCGRPLDDHDDEEDHVFHWEAINPGDNPPDPCADKAPAWSRIVWCDLELTGLDPATDLLLEAFVAVTDERLNVVSRELVLIRHGDDTRKAVERLIAERRKSKHPDLKATEEWHEKHGRSGLYMDAEQWGVSLRAAETRLMAAVRRGLKDVPAAFRPPLGGCSPSTDRAFLTKGMPRFAAELHHRTVDVSCIRNALRAWGGVYPEAWTIEYEHRAMSDCLYAIEVARLARAWIVEAARARAPQPARALA